MNARPAAVYLCVALWALAACGGAKPALARTRYVMVGIRIFAPNELNAYSINSVTGRKGGDGAITVQFGNCSSETPNCLPVTKGWNETWSFPVAEPTQ